MNKEQKLHISDTLKAQRLSLNISRSHMISGLAKGYVLDIINKLDDLEMYVRMLPVENK